MRNLVVFRIQNIWFAADAAWVEQVLGPQPWTPIPTLPPQWPGVMAFRGKAVAVLELAPELNKVSSMREQERRQRTVIARVSDCTVAIPVHEVREVQAVEEAQVVTAHASSHRLAHEEIVINGVVAALLDLPALILEAIANASPV